MYPLKMRYYPKSNIPRIIKMKKFLISAVVCACASGSVVAGEFGVGVSYSGISQEEAGLELGFSGVSVVGTYALNPDDRLSHVIELGYGTGISDDAAAGATFKLDNYRWIGYRAEYHFTDRLYGVASVARGSLKLSACALGNCASESETRTGYGAGLGIFVLENTKLEVVIADFDGIEVLSTTVRWDL